MLYSFCLSKMGKRYATRQKTRESAVMSAEKLKTGRTFCRTLLPLGHTYSRRAFFSAGIFLNWFPFSISAAKTKARQRSRHHRGFRH